MESSWRVILMDELYDFKEERSKTFIKPIFPTSRWGKIYTKTSTTDVNSLNTLLIKLKSSGLIVRKRIEKKTKRGVFFKLEIKDHPSKLSFKITC